MISSRDFERPDQATLKELRTVRTEIRRTCRQANLLAGAAARFGTDAYWVAMADVFDRWISQSSGKQSVVCFASAAKVGLLLERHINYCRSTAASSGQQVLQAVYSMVMKNQDELRRVRTGNGFALTVSPARSPNAGGQPICAACSSLLMDLRRGPGHPHLHSVSEGINWSFSANVTIRLYEHRCSRCQSLWKMIRRPADPFVSWILLRGL